MSNILSRFFSKKKVLTSVLLGSAAITALIPSTVFAADPTVWVDEANDDLRISGSTTCYPIVAAALGITGNSGGIKDDGPFQSANGNLQAELRLGGSSVGILDSMTQNNDVGLASRTLKSTETGEQTAFARDGVCVIVGEAVAAGGVTNITASQIKDIYEGLRHRSPGT